MINISNAYSDSDVPPGEVASDAEQYLSRCPVCNDANISFLFWGKSSYHNHWYKYYKCPHCSLVFMNPRVPSSRKYESVEYQGNAHFFYVSKIALDGIEFRRNIVNPASNVIPPKAPDGSCRKWLDVGCAVGNLLEEAKQRGYQPYGLELNLSMVNWVRQHRPYLSLYQGSVDSLPPDQPYDIISMDNVLEHINEPFEFLTKIISHLRDNSLLVIRVPNYNTIFRYLYERIGKLQTSFIIDPDAHPCNYSIHPLRILLKRCGMEIIQKNENLMISYPLRHILGKMIQRWSSPMKRASQYAYSCCFLFDKIIPLGGIDIAVFARKIRHP